MKRLLALLSISLFALFCACSEDGPDSDGQVSDAGGAAGEPGNGGTGFAGNGGQAGQAGTAGSSEGGSSQSGGSSQGEGGSAGSPTPSVPLCQMSCSVPADCTTAGSYPENEWSCDKGLCRYDGCSSDDSCAQVYKTTDYVCRPYPGASIDMCQKKCSVAQDCAMDTGAWSAENWKCQGDYCVYLGCSSDLECKTSMAGLDFRCRDMPALGYKSCVKGCGSPADCAVPGSPAYAASTYDCNQGVCEYLGCPNDAACQQSLNSQKYVCK